MSIMLNRTPSAQGATGLPRIRTQPIGRTGPASMELYSSAQRVYQSSIGGRVFTAQSCTAMRVLPSRTPSVQGSAGLPTMCTKPVGDVRVAPPWSCTAPYSGCTKIPLTEECSTASGELPSESFGVIHPVY